MKNIFYLLLLAPLLTACSGGGKKAVAYNDSIVRHQVLVVEAINRLDRSFEKGDMRETEEMRVAALKQLSSSSQAISATGSYEGNDLLLNAALKLMVVYKSLLEKQYAEIISLGETHLRKLSVFQQKKLNKLRTDIRLELDLALEEFRGKQKEFAGKYGFRLNDAVKNDEKKK